jgi:hypothetical protein
MSSVLIRNARLVNEGRESKGGFALPALLELVEDEILPITTLVAKTSHRVADLFAIPDRGYLRKGYWADLVLIKPEPCGFAVSRQPVLSMRLDTLRRAMFSKQHQHHDRIGANCLARQTS